ncbi:MAG: Ig-like domain-containing protein [Alistipes shahii]
MRGPVRRWPPCAWPTAAAASESTPLAAAPALGGHPGPAGLHASRRCMATDDNHAWVEAGADGRWWHFSSGLASRNRCSTRWFNAPKPAADADAHQGLSVIADGPEEVMKTTANYTEINVISNYAACAPLTVTVTDTAGSPVEGATVEFKLYNYAEFFTVSRKTTDGRGQASLSAGLGDMLVTAVRDGRFGHPEGLFRGGSRRRRWR